MDSFLECRNFDKVRSSYSSEEDVIYAKIGEKIKGKDLYNGCYLEMESNIYRVVEKKNNEIIIERIGPYPRETVKKTFHTESAFKIPAKRLVRITDNNDYVADMYKLTFPYHQRETGNYVWEKYLQ